ncbi:MAG TPA: asparagine synthase-related protein, partial [Pilimelia sp.]|nr:asparagine synthase-related protein [Pilimelia sp.]
MTAGVAGRLSGSGAAAAAVHEPAGGARGRRPADGPAPHGQLALAGDVGTAARDGLVVQLAGGLPLAGAADAIGSAAALATAWRRLGERALDRIPGGWLAVVWDEPARTLVCARSPRGFRRLFWRADGDGLRFGTALADVVGPVRRLNEDFLVELLANRVTTRDETPFAGVHRLPAGHLLRARPGEPPTVRRWHDPSPGEPLDVDRAEAARLLRRQLETVIAEHVPATTGVLVSGGLDSNTVLAVARRVVAPERDRVVGCSMVFPGQPHDESAWLDAVDRHHPEPVWRLVARDYDWSAWRDWSAASLLPPLRPNIAKSDPAVRLLAAAGIRGVLTGEGGDDWFGSGPLHWPGLLRRGQVRRVLGA